MQAIGIFETKGLLAAVEALDVMLKTADVRLIEKYLVGGGLVCTVVTGEVAAVKASIGAAEAAVMQLGAGLLNSSHVIPRPDTELETLWFTPPEDDPEENDPDEDDPTPDAPEPAPGGTPNDATPAGETTEIPAENPADTIPSAETLAGMKTVELRNLARQYNDFPIQGRDISKAKKAELLELFRTYDESK